MTFRTFFWELFGGSGVRGPELLSGDFFETFRGFGVLGSVDDRGDPNPRICMFMHRRHAVLLSRGHQMSVSRTHTRMTQKGGSRHLGLGMTHDLAELIGPDQTRDGLLANTKLPQKKNTETKPETPKKTN